MTIYRASERGLSEGDSVQFTEPDKMLEIANRELGTIESIDERSYLGIKLDSGRQIHFNLEENRHLNYSSAVTRHSSRVPRPTECWSTSIPRKRTEKLINSRLAYVAISRAMYDAQIYTNDAGKFGTLLRCVLTHASAVEVCTHDMGIGQSDRNVQQRGHRNDYPEKYGFASELE